MSRSRLSRLEKAMFGDRKFDREPIVTEEVEQYRPPPSEEKQSPNMTSSMGGEISKTIVKSTNY